mmetsp:Transcript_18989/g.48590  ORF Transcript_18989/g.48590 Transcript_18989/m.48590 type:complete len:676 (+) Transcript_18989:59-2086(+)
MQSAVQRFAEQTTRVVTFKADQSKTAQYSFEVSHITLFSGLPQADANPVFASMPGAISSLAVQFRRRDKLAVTNFQKIPAQAKSSGGGVSWDLERLRFVATLFRDRGGKPMKKMYNVVLLDNNCREIAECECDVSQYVDSEFPQERTLNLKRADGCRELILIKVRICAQLTKKKSRFDDNDDTDSFTSSHQSSMSNDANEQDLSGFPVLATESTEQQLANMQSISSTFKKTPSARSNPATAGNHVTFQSGTGAMPDEDATEPDKHLAQKHPAVGSTATKTEEGADGQKTSGSVRANMVSLGARLGNLTLSRPPREEPSLREAESSVSWAQSGPAASAYATEGSDPEPSLASQERAWWARMTPKAAALPETYSAGAPAASAEGRSSASVGASPPASAEGSPSESAEASPPASPPDRHSHYKEQNTVRTSHLSTGVDDLGAMRRELSGLGHSLMGFRTSPRSQRDSFADDSEDWGEEETHEESSAAGERPLAAASPPRSGHAEGEADRSGVVEEDTVLARALAMLKQSSPAPVPLVAAGRLAAVPEDAKAQVEVAETAALAIKLREAQIESEQLCRRAKEAESQAAAAEAESARLRMQLAAARGNLERTSLRPDPGKSTVDIIAADVSCRLADGRSADALRKELIEAKLCAAQAAYERDLARAKHRFVKFSLATPVM